MTRRRSVVTLLRRLAVRGPDDQVDRRTNVESIVCSEACLFSSCVFVGFFLLLLSLLLLLYSSSLLCSSIDVLSKLK